MRVSVASALAMAAALSGSTVAAAADQPDVYVFAGQSNMSGRGAVEDLTDAERAPDTRIMLYGNDSVLRVAAEPLDSAANQIDTVSADAKAGVGPGLFFARRMLRLRGTPIVLVTCAKGGTSIELWKSGGGRDTLYGSCLARIREQAGRVRAVLWYQGESDGQSTLTAQNYAANFTQLIENFRADLSNKSLPFAFVQLAQKSTAPERAARYPGWETVQAAQAAQNLPCTRMISARGLGLKEDDLHLTTASQRALGPQLADAVTVLIKQGCGSAGKSDP